MVLVFVGFMAGHNHYGNSIAMGSVGLVTTTFYTFLLCFLFILAGVPLIERTQENKKVKEISLAGLDYITLGWTVISFIAMYRFKSGMITWIGISAVFGLVYYWTTL